MEENLSVPTGFKSVSQTTGFVESTGPRGPCFEWYQLVDSVWKRTHLLHEENWLLKENA